MVNIEEMLKVALFDGILYCHKPNPLRKGGFI